MPADREEYRRRIAALTARAQRTSYSVCVLGPGVADGPGYAKRSAIVEELRTRGFAADTPEEVDQKLASTELSAVPAGVRELLLFQDSDCIVVLNTPTAYGTVAELGQIQTLMTLRPDFADLVVLHPYQYLPQVEPPDFEAGYVASLIREMPRIPYTENEFSVCSLVAECMRRLEAYRWKKGNSEVGGGLNLPSLP